MEGRHCLDSKRQAELRGLLERVARLDFTGQVGYEWALLGELEKVCQGQLNKLERVAGLLSCGREELPSRVEELLVDNRAMAEELSRLNNLPRQQGQDWQQRLHQLE